MLNDWRVGHPEPGNQPGRGRAAGPVPGPARTVSGVDDPGTWPTGRLLSAAARMVEHEWNAHLGAWDLNHAGLAVAHVLLAGPLPQRALASAVQVEEQTLSRTVEHLERCGHVERRRDPADRRRILVNLTDRGRSACRDATAGAASEEYFRSAGIDVPALREALVGLVGHLSTRRWPGGDREDRDPGDRPDGAAARPPDGT